jgi:outer membrane protein assembly complex protein YaeT
MRRRVALLLAVLLAGTAGRATAEVTDFINKTVSSVAVTVDGRRSRDQRIESLIEIRPGDALTIGNVRESIGHVFSLGTFQDVRVDAEPDGSNVAVTFVLVSARAITGVAVSGSGPGIDRGRLKEAVVERFGARPGAARAADAARLLESEIQQLGYLHPQVTPRFEDDGSGATTLVLAITPGARTHIGEVTLQGDAGMSEAALRGRLDVAAGAPFEREVLNGRIARYLDERRRAGFYEARLALAVQLADEDRVANLTFTASQGPHVRIVFRGDPLPEDRREDLVPIAREGAVDEDLLEDSRNRIEEYLQALGYKDAQAPYSREESEGELLLIFTIDRGPQYRVARVELSGATSLPASMLQPRLRVRAGQPFSQAAIDGDIALLEDSYHREGFASATATAVTTNEPGAPGASEVAVSIQINVVEGVQTIVNAIEFDGNAAVPSTVLAANVGLTIGRPFFVTQLAVDRDAIETVYANRGYLSASVTSNPGLNASGTQANVRFTIREGTQVFVDHILIVGNDRTQTSTIERELQLKPGDPLSREALNESQRRLTALGLFRRARITEVAHGDESRRDLLVTIDEAPVVTLGYGGGIEAGQVSTRTDEGGPRSERIEFAPRAFFEIGRRNLFGKNRSINLFTRVSLRARNGASPDESIPASSSQSGYGFTEYRVIGTFREPRVAGTAADAFLTGTIEQQKRSSFNFARRAFSAEVGRRVTSHVSLSGNYQIQRTELFDEQIDQEFALLIDRAFPQVRLSSFSLSGVRDTRDDLTDPLTGAFLSANAQVAGRFIESEIGFAKTYLTGQFFRPVLARSRTIFAASARLGLAVGFPRQVPELDADNNPILDPNGVPLTRTSRDLPASERFFAGGDTTVRGFSLDQLGTDETLDKDGFPIGGKGLMIFNAELRIPIHGGFGVVGFVDAGNVFREASDMSLGDLRSSAGFGVRYKSPIGPIRVDVGFKTTRREIGGTRETPAALHISLGQAF